MPQEARLLARDIALNGDGLLTVQARGRGVEHQIDGKAGTALLVAAQKHAVVVQHRFAPDLGPVQPALTGGDALGLLVDEQAVSNLLAQARERALMQVEVVCEGGAVQPGLFLGLLVKTLRVRADELVRRARAPCEPQVAAQVVAGAELLLDARELVGRIDAAAEAALDVAAVLRFVLVGAQTRAQRVRDLDHAVFARHGRAADGQIVRADDLRRQELGEKRCPLVVKVQLEPAFFMHCTVELQVFFKCRAHGDLKLRGVHRAGAGERLRKPLFPRGENGRLLPEDRLPAVGLHGVDELIFLHPLLSRKLIFRREEFLRVLAAEIGKHRALGQLLFIRRVLERQPAQLVENVLPRVARPVGKETLWHLVAEPLVHKADDAVHVKVRLAV